MPDYSLLNNEEDYPGLGLVLKKARAKSASGTLTSNVSPGQALPNAMASILPKDDYYGRSAELFDRGMQLFNADPDTTQLQQFAKQRGEQGDAAMLNALAAQFAGENFAPVQEQMLKKAAAARDPIKLAGGMVTADGQFIKDPFAAQEKQAQMILQQAQAYATLAQNGQNARERLLAQRQHDQAMEAYREIMTGISRMNADTARLTAEGNLGSRADKQSDSLRGEYLKRADKIREGTGHAQNVMQMLTDPSIAKDPTKQVSLIFSFGKMLDPDSVVRESEYSLIANARGLADKLQQIVPQIQSGARLTPQQLKSMQEVAASLLQGSSTRQQDLDNYYADLAQRRRLNVADVLPSYSRSTGKVVDFSNLPK